MVIHGSARIRKSKLVKKSHINSSAVNLAMINSLCFFLSSVILCMTNAIIQLRAHFPKNLKFIYGFLLHIYSFSSVIFFIELFIVGVQKAAQNGAQITKAHGTDMCCAFSFVGCASTAKRRQMFCLKQTNKKQQITEREKRNRQRPPNQPYGTNLRDIINCLFPFLFAFMIQIFFLRTYCI